MALTGVGKITDIDGRVIDGGGAKKKPATAAKAGEAARKTRAPTPLVPRKREPSLEFRSLDVTLGPVRGRR